MTKSKRLTKLKQLKRAQAIVTQLRSELKADSKPAAVKVKVKPDTTPARIDQAAEILLSSNNRVQVQSDDEPVYFRSNQQARIM